MKILDPTITEGWDSLVRELPGASFFHSAAWAKVLKRSYGYQPLYFVKEEGCLSAVIPLMEVSSFLTGKRAVSLPFTDYCEPLAPHNEVSKVLFDAIIQEGKKRGWKYVELRGNAGFLNSKQASASYYCHTLSLTPGVEKLFSSLRDSTRRNIKKAEKEGVEIRFETSLKALREFYRLNCLTRCEHGLPPQPWQFFVNIHDEIISKGEGIVALGFFEGRPVAANVYMHSNGDAIYKYGASDKAYQHLRANNLLMWEAIKRFTGEGCRQLCLGRTDPENEGLRQFKSGWGAKEHIINYYRYNMASNDYIPARQRVSSAANRFFSSMPLPVSRVIGAMLYRHVG
jgi:hypothetical protein